MKVFQLKKLAISANVLLKPQFKIIDQDALADEILEKANKYGEYDLELEAFKTHSGRVEVVTAHVDLTTLDECIERAINCDDGYEHGCDLNLEVDGDKHYAYSVAIGHRELTFSCLGGTYLHYDINRIGKHDTALLTDISKED